MTPPAGPAAAQAQSGPAAPANGAPCANADVQPSAANLAVVDQATLCLVNAQRSAQGLPALNDNARLDSAATGHSLDMVATNYFDHTSPVAGPFDQRIRRTGYYDPAGAYAIGENIAWGTGVLATPRKIVEAWMNSAEHRANILNPSFRDSGIGVAPAAPAMEGQGSGGATYTQDFGRNS